ncbi:MAG: HD domain-containing protein [Paludibacter sp.]|nr:HD domain-containing protein [Bacteroidales bacterium]MCM1068786.1 HD domain-containing protein [Prevotella sp.]MCM1353927.1 HD domain-containing protein [Bacteroides sp.]MCM1443325.1 HD domain-containing protein [Muribaculum sp.]MCM1482134.1 HD domain-containing protein [Paludibacter sp.]
METLLKNMADKYGICFTDAETEALLKLPLSTEQKQFQAEAIHVAVSEIGLHKIPVLGMLLRGTDCHDLPACFDAQVRTIVEGLRRVDELYKVNTSLETENFRKLLLTLAEDVRVVLIIIAERVALMRRLNGQEDSEQRQNIARETSFLYAPLAHRLGLYAVKTELEDLSLKYTEYATYKDIAHTLNETKRHRDAYIAAFINPLKEKLEALGYKFSIKGRTKSIHSIYKKMQKQNTTVDHIYDLFAIRIILDSAPEKEKAECWQVYSVIADMYQPNPKRLRDWLTIPKSNGYESLHTTVLGPENKWVEVQIRTRRMDEIAEKGVAAHWKYKGIQSETGMDEFLKGVREMLESPAVETKDAINDFRLNFYEQEVFVFTPNGDLHKLPKGATVLDFAFAIHTGLGCRCVGGKIAGRNVPIRHVLHNGDQVEILTSPQQKPTQAWLSFVCTSKAKNKIRQTLKEVDNKDAAEGRELLERRFRNWKLEYEEGRVSRLAKKLGYKVTTQFYQALAQGKEDILGIKDVYQDIEHAEQGGDVVNTISAENFVAPVGTVENTAHDELVIDRDLKNIDYKLAKCCNPIYGDDIFGFVSITNGIKIHRKDCPNAQQMQEKFPYRIVPARWSGKAVGQQYPITLRVVGNDDIGIVTNISSLIAKEQGMSLRTIAIDSHDGLFEGHLTILVADLNQLEQIRKKIAQVKGVKHVVRV